MNKPRITIVSYSWPPRNSISTHRPYAWARYWSKKGAKITVLTSKKQMFDEPLDMKLPELKDVNVIEVPYGSYLSPIINIFLKFSIIEKIGKWVRANPTKYIGSNYDPRDAWSLAVTAISTKIARKTDILISTYGPEAAHVIASKMKIINPSIFWIADYRDLWSENPRLNNASKKFKKNIKNKEIETLKGNADLITSITKVMAKRLSKMHKIPAITVTNGFDIDEKIVKKNFYQKKSNNKKNFKNSIYRYDIPKCK